MNLRILSLLLFSSVLLPPSFVCADGGVVRLSERRDGCQITVFTTPTPFRAGPVDISVLVQNAETGNPISDARVTVRTVPRGRPAEAVQHTATSEAATNKLFQAAVFDLPEAGWWEVEIAVEREQKIIRTRFEVEAADPPPRWWSLWGWIGWPALAILLYGVHQLLVRRRQLALRPRTRSIPRPSFSSARTPE
jgi:hypothetical protein